MPEWRSPDHLARHFRAHARRLHVRSIAAYDASARDTIERGIGFEYRDLDSNQWRRGYYDPHTRRFTALSDDGSTILTHYTCSESYVRDTLQGSTYP